MPSPTRPAAEQPHRQGTPPGAPSRATADRAIHREPARAHLSGLRAWSRRVADWVLRGEAPERVVYGTILVGALIAAESGVHDGYADKVGSTLLALAIYWLAHSYSTVLGRRIATQERLNPGALRRAMAYDWGIVRGGCIPLLAIVVCWAASASQATAVDVAVWTAVVSLIVFELVAGLRARSAPRELILECGVGVAMGLAILALKSLAH